MTSDERWEKVGAHINKRMTELGMSQADLVRQSGVSEFTVRKLMRGLPGRYRPDRLAKVAIALEWLPDSIDRIARYNLGPVDNAPSGAVMLMADGSEVDLAGAWLAYEAGESVDPTALEAAQEIRASEQHRLLFIEAVLVNLSARLAKLEDLMAAMDTSRREQSSSPPSGRASVQDQP